MTASQIKAVQPAIKAHSKPAPAVRKSRPISATVLMVLLYVVFLAALATVYVMNLYLISAAAAVMVLIGLSAAALFLLFLILKAR